MDRLASLRRWDPISIALAALASAGLTIALVVPSRPSDVANIPDHLQDRVRGSNRAYKAVYDDTCTDENVNTYNLSQPPPPAVSAFGRCANVGQPCIMCSNGSNYFLQNMPSNPGVKNKQPGIVNCDVNGGTIGSCQLDNNDNLICFLGPGFGMAYDCYTAAISYPNQGM